MVCNLRKKAGLAMVGGGNAVAAMLCLGALVASTHAFDPLSQASHRVEPLSRALHRDRWDWNCEFCSSPRAILSLSEADGRPLLSLACLLTVSAWLSQGPAPTTPIATIWGPAI